MGTKPFKPHNVPLVALICVVVLASSAAITPRTSAESTPAPATKETAPAATRVGSETCLLCHEDVKAQMQKTFHGQAAVSVETKQRGVFCEGCHGPGSIHAENPMDEAAVAALKRTAANGDGCFNCHASRLSRVKWQGSPHARGSTTCLACHGEKDKPHGEMTRKPSSDLCVQCHAEKRAEFALPSHHPVKEGRVHCADCHDPHAAPDQRMKRDVCVSCHAGQRGPFRYAHGAISGRLTDGCLDCHRPHGSPNKQLLKLTNRGLCLQCHGNKAAHASGRRCWNCHQAVHGSNSHRLFFRR